MLVRSMKDARVVTTSGLIDVNTSRVSNLTSKKNGSSNILT